MLVIMSLFGSIAMVYLLAQHSSRILNPEPPKETEEAFFELPFSIRQTGLVAEAMVCYEGVFMEDNTASDICNVAALMIKNAGGSGVTDGIVMVWQGGRELRFEVSQLPPGSAVLVLEREAQAYSREPLEACQGWAVCEETGWDIGSYIAIEEIAPGGVTVTNIREEMLCGVRLYYKTEYPEGGFYLGGITYELELGTLEPGQTVELYPEHYCCGSSRILRILVEKTSPSQPEAERDIGYRTLERKSCSLACWG